MAFWRYPKLKWAARWLERFVPLSGRLRENLRQWLMRAVLEPDFYLFDQLRDVPGLFLDIGANRGHAAITVLRRTRRFRVVSLEPNTELRWSLMLLQLLHPWRFRFRLVAAGNQSGPAILAIPLADSDLSTQASLDPEEFAKPYVQERLKAHGHGGKSSDFRHRPVQVCRVDDLQLVPDVVKIDVEGWEAQALEGMSRLLALHRPMLIIEINNSHLWAPGLAAQGYLFFTFEGGQLLHHEDWAAVPGLNVICCHPASSSAITARLLPASLELRTVEP